MGTINTISQRMGVARTLMAREINRALEDGADEVLRRSSMQVPFDTGTLKDSGKTNKAKNGSIEIIYNSNKKAPYATEVHEVAKNYRRGRKKKYLEDPLREFVPKFSAFIRQKIKSVF